MAQEGEASRHQQRSVEPGSALGRVGVVRKFGGTSVLDGARIREVARLVEELGAGDRWWWYRRWPALPMLCALAEQAGEARSTRRSGWRRGA